MRKGEIFTLTAPNGVEVTAVVLSVEHVHQQEDDTLLCSYLCYAQNRIFWLSSYYGDVDGETKEWDLIPMRTVVDYAVLPDYDAMLEAYSDHLVTMSEEEQGM